MGDLFIIISLPGRFQTVAEKSRPRVNNPAGANKLLSAPLGEWDFESPFRSV